MRVVILFIVVVLIRQVLQFFVRGFGVYGVPKCDIEKNLPGVSII